MKVCKVIIMMVVFIMLVVFAAYDVISPGEFLISVMLYDMLIKIGDIRDNGNI